MHALSVEQRDSLSLLQRRGIYVSALETRLLHERLETGSSDQCERLQVSVRVLVCVFKCVRSSVCVQVSVQVGVFKCVCSS